MVRTVESIYIIRCGIGWKRNPFRDRIDKMVKLFCTMYSKFFGKKEIEKQTKMMVFKMYKHVLTFSCESWVLNEGQRIKIQAVGWNIWRRAKRVTVGIEETWKYNLYWFLLKEGNWAGGDIWCEWPREIPYRDYGKQE